MWEFIWVCAYKNSCVCVHTCVCVCVCASLSSLSVFLFHPVHVAVCKHCCSWNPNWPQQPTQHKWMITLSLPLYSSSSFFSFFFFWGGSQPQENKLYMAVINVLDRVFPYLTSQPRCSQSLVCKVQIRCQLLVACFQFCKLLQGSCSRFSERGKLEHNNPHKSQLSKQTY